MDHHSLRHDHHDLPNPSAVHQPLTIPAAFGFTSGFTHFSSASMMSDLPRSVATTAVTTRQYLPRGDFSARGLSHPWPGLFYQNSFCRLTRPAASANCPLP